MAVLMCPFHTRISNGTRPVLSKEVFQKNVSDHEVGKRQNVARKKDNIGTGGIIGEGFISSSSTGL